MSTSALAPPVHVIAACDDVYAMPLAATAASVGARSADPGRLHFTVIDCGMSWRNRQRVRRSVEGTGAFISLPRFASRVPDDALRGGVIPSVAAYARLYAADYCPSQDRAVYLDSDTIVTVDVEELVQQLQPGALVAGVLDTAGDGRTSQIERLSAFAPDIPEDSPYVNSGVLVFDLASWRSEGMGARCSALLAQQPFASGDQDVINLAAAGRIQALDPSYNVQTHLMPPRHEQSVEAVLASAKVIHYTQRPKPWHARGDVDVAGPWYDAVDLTAWHGWRPTGRRLIGPKARRGWRMARLRAAGAAAGLLPGGPSLTAEARVSRP